MNFIAIDFETANNERHSACSLALVVVRDNQIVDTFYTLIKPETPFSSRNIDIHGIRPEDVAKAPKFDEVWPHIAPLFSPNHLVIAHNAPFDNGVLLSTLRYYRIQTPHYLSLDTVRTSRKLFPNMKNHRLNTVAAELAIPLNHHHNALDDSLACAKILIYQEENFGAYPLKQLVKQVG